MGKKRKRLPQYVVVKNGDWYVRRTYKLSHDLYANGVPRRVDVSRKCVPETAERAAEISKAIDAAIQKGKTEHGDPQTLGNYIQAYLAIKKPSITQRTHDDYIALFERYIKGTALANERLEAVKTKTLQTYIASLETKGVSPAMVRKVFVLLSMTFRQAVLWDDLVKSPTTGVLLPKVDHNEAVALTKGDAQRLIAVLRTNPEYLIFEFALETGMRPQEIIALSWSKIDIDNRRVRIDRAVSSGLKGGGFALKETKTRSSVRTVSFSSYMQRRLMEHKTAYDKRLAHLQQRINRPIAFNGKKTGVNYQKRKAKKEHAITVLRNYQKYDLVFPSTIGLPLSINNLNRREFKSALTAAGLDPAKYSFKCLRHTNASIMAETVNPKRLQKHLGHSQLSTTMGWYVHVEDGGDDDNAAVVAALYS